MQGAFFMQKLRGEEMTTIQMITNDQTLIAVQSPKVAAGDVNSTILHIDFDATWDVFEIKSAVFHTAKNPTVQEVLLTDNECIIPASVLAEDGILFVGVRGVTADGETVKTSTLVKYKIVEGATASQKTLYPELDMYQQYLVAITEKVRPIIEAHCKELVDKVSAEYEVIAANKEGIEVWTNEETTTAFAAQTVSLDLSNYNRIIVVFKVINTEAWQFETQCRKDSENYAITAYYGYADTDHADVYLRSVKMLDNGVQFGNAKRSRLSAVANDLCIPYKIIAYKY